MSTHGIDEQMKRSYLGSQQYLKAAFMTCFVTQLTPLTEQRGSLKGLLLMIALRMSSAACAESVPITGNPSSRRSKLPVLIRKVRTESPVIGELKFLVPVLLTVYRVLIASNNLPLNITESLTF